MFLLNGVMWLAKEIAAAAQQEEEAESGRIREQLRELYQRLEVGQISEDAFDQEERMLLDRLDAIEGKDDASSAAELDDESDDAADLAEDEEEEDEDEEDDEEDEDEEDDEEDDDEEDDEEEEDESEEDEEESENLAAVTHAPEALERLAS